MNGLIAPEIVVPAPPDAAPIHDGRRARPSLLLFAALAGSSYIASHYIAVDHHPYMIALHGLFASTLLLILIDRDKSFATPRRHWGPLAYCGAGVAATPFLTLYGSQIVSPGLAAVLVISNALMIALLSWLLGRKRFTPVQVVAMAAGFGGVVAVTLAQGNVEGRPEGVAALLLAAALIATMTIVFEPTVRELGAVAATKRNFALSFIVALGVAAGGGLLDFHSAGQSALGLVYGLCSVGAPILLFNVGMRLVGAADAANYKLLIPFFALLYAALGFGELPDPGSTVAAGVVVASVAVYQRASIREERNPQP
ncbi:MAG: DMT family transporter [Nitrospinae bacterium]|nr:DMT family transporter [Nitrospinota bacterium]